MLCSLYYQVNINKEDPWTNILNYKQYSLGPDYDTNNNEKGIYIQIQYKYLHLLQGRSCLARVTKTFVMLKINALKLLLLSLKIMLKFFLKAKEANTIKRNKAICNCVIKIRGYMRDLLQTENLPFIYLS